MGTAMMDQHEAAQEESVELRLGAVSYLNTLPMIEGLEKLRHVTLTRAAPSQLVPMLDAGEVDVALGPVIDSQRASQRMTLLPCGMIGSDGTTMTVRLFSAVPIERITTLHADTESHTSVALARVLLDRVYGLQPEVMDCDVRQRMARADGEHAQASGWPETLLMIGDKVVSDSPPAARYTHQLDLGEAWKEWTGLPFVYAVWMCRAAGEESASVRAAVALLDRQQRLNVQRIGWIVTKRAAEHRWPIDQASAYLRDAMVYRLDDNARLSIERFFDEAHELGLLKHRHPTRWRAQD